MPNTVYKISFTDYNKDYAVMHLDGKRNFIIHKKKRDSLTKVFEGDDEEMKEELYQKLLVFKNKDEKVASIQDFQYKKKVLSSEAMDKISSVFSFMYHKKVMVITILSIFCIDVYFYFINKPIFLNNIQLDMSWFIIAFVFFFHEIGHSTACKYCGGKASEIGFGITMLMPALYADVSTSWYFDKKGRMLVNFGGIYFQNIFAFFFLILSLLIDNSNMYYVSKTIFFSTIYQLFPYYKSDGYWVLTDMVEEPRLYRKSQNIFYGFLKNQKLKMEKRTVWLFVYYLCLEVVVVWFILITFIRYWDKVVSLPSYLYSIIKGIISADMGGVSFDFGYIVILLALFFTCRVIHTNLKLFFCSDD